MTQGGVQQQQPQQQQQPNEQDRIVSSPNHPPNANAGPDKKVNEGSTVNLDARRSSDPDSGNKITYSWKQLAGRPLVDLGLSADGSTASFAAPSVDRDTVLTYAVTVTDEKGAQDRDTVKVTVNNVETSVPKLGTTNSNNPLDNTTANALSNAQLSDRNNNGNININRTGSANHYSAKYSVIPNVGHHASSNNHRCWGSPIKQHCKYQDNIHYNIQDCFCRYYKDCRDDLSIKHCHRRRNYD